MPKKREPKSFLMSLALLGTGAIETLEEVDKGTPLLSAIGAAVENTRIRGRAMKRAGKAAAREIRERSRDEQD